MGDVLVYVDPAINGRLLAFGRGLADATGGQLIALYAGGESPNGALGPADVVLEVAHPALTPYLPEAHQAVLTAAVKERAPDVVLVENTTAGYDVGAAVAAAAGLPFVGFCLSVSVLGGEAEAVSALYGGQLHATVQTPLPAVFAVNSVALTEEPRAGGMPERGRLAPPPELDALRTTFAGTVAPPQEEGVNLDSAELIVCVGRGIGGAENIELAEELAEALGAELGASRPVIDSGWVPKARQIGKSGANVRPKLYLGLGVSGAPEHVEGMQGAELIVAVNTDPAAAIFNVAHYGAVADLFEVVDELTERLG
jgi:electron transfer flavoprotein alpha subunit